MQETTTKPEITVASVKGDLLTILFSQVACAHDVSLRLQELNQTPDILETHNYVLNQDLRIEIRIVHGLLANVLERLEAIRP